MNTSDDYLELATPDGATIRVLRTVHPRARRLRLTVSSGGARVSYPQGTHAAQVFAFLRKHGEWLERKLEELRLDAPLAPLRPGVPLRLRLRGEPLRLVWRRGLRPSLEIDQQGLTLTLPQPYARSSLPLAYGLLRSFLEARMRRDLGRQLGRHCAQLGAAPSCLRLRPLKSLWGSLDVRGRVSLDLALVLAPPAVLRYVLIHELCHLRVRSHAPRFWALVEQLCPDWRQQRDWLRLNGQALKAELQRLIGPSAPD